MKTNITTNTTKTSKQIYARLQMNFDDLPQNLEMSTLVDIYRTVIAGNLESVLDFNNSNRHGLKVLLKNCVTGLLYLEYVDAATERLFEICSVYGGGVDSVPDDKLDDFRAAFPVALEEIHG